LGLSACEPHFLISGNEQNQASNFQSCLQNTYIHISPPSRLRTVYSMIKMQHSHTSPHLSSVSLMKPLTVLHWLTSITSGYMAEYWQEM